jgi:hypothetical protein
MATTVDVDAAAAAAPPETADPAFEILKKVKPYSVTEKLAAVEKIVEKGVQKDFFGVAGNDALLLIADLKNSYTKYQRERIWTAAFLAKQICKIYDLLDQSGDLRKADQEENRRSSRSTTARVPFKWSPEAAAIRKMVEECRQKAAEAENKANDTKQGASKKVRSDQHQYEVALPLEEKREAEEGVIGLVDENSFDKFDDSPEDIISFSTTFRMACNDFSLRKKKTERPKQRRGK